MTPGYDWWCIWVLHDCIHGSYIIYGINDLANNDVIIKYYDLNVSIKLWLEGANYLNN